ncbi:MAG: hypothetical protein K2X27_13935 [Candidatus Obscuribacterales bacterium]|nr:hypothetical protein [Candidatus Obscuribacterales bacterium]
MRYAVKFFLLSLIAAAAQNPAFAESETQATSALQRNTVIESAGLSPHVKVSTSSILQMLESLPVSRKSPVSIKVPSGIYLSVLQDLQNRHAHFLLPGAEAPAEARAVFQLKAEELGMSQLVYLL